jgi:hypothetical protein
MEEEIYNKQINAIAQFITAEKFNVSEEFFYQGISKPPLQEVMTNLINQSAEDFIDVIKSRNNEEDFIEQIEKGLKRIDIHKYDLDTSDKEMVCTYYQKLMDMVNLESSKGLLNSWLYGFDPLNT